jgi:hypothetical protein
LNAAQAASQPIPHYIRLNYSELFKIQQVRNPYTLNPVSFSRLARYLECPSCALDQGHKCRPKEPQHFTTVHQSSMFNGQDPDARLLGSLLHLLVDMLHDPQTPISRQQQALALTDPDHLTTFLRDGAALKALQQAGKVRLAMFFDELCSRKRWFGPHVLVPLLRYQRELMATGNHVLAHSERFHFKLLSTTHTFPKHPDWGGFVGLVGEFDQVRLRFAGDSRRERPAIMEFKKSLGGKKSHHPSAVQAGLFASEGGKSSASQEMPTDAHAMQLMVYWLAFQTRWDILDHVTTLKGKVQDISMPTQQDLDLIIYNLNDGRQYQLVCTNHQEALRALVTCIFYLNWAMKSGYARRAAEHECRKTQLLELPLVQVQVGYQTISSEDCYTLARDAFSQFKRTMSWNVVPVVSR